MTMNPFPPQAYTRETLVKAYQWLQNQNAQMKELATTPDLLISLYVKAKNQGEDFLERPSLKTFKSELKNLAGMMGEFETHDSPPSALLSATAAHSSGSANSSSSAHSSVGNATSTMNSVPPSANYSSKPTMPPTGSHSPQATPQVLSPVFQLDPRSLVIVQEIKTTLNLSSDTEALRMLISMGHNRLKSL
jgi:hypothetical protein